MSSRLTDYLGRSTALQLTARFALLFLLCASALFITVDLLLARAQLEKDQQLIGSFMESYQRLEQQAGLHKLELVIERDAPFFQRSAMRVELIGGDGKPLMLVEPDAWTYDPAATAIALKDSDGSETTLPGSDLRLLTSQATLSDGTRLRIGKSTAPREQELSGYRKVVLAVMLPLLGIGLLLTAYMNWRALRPVHDLIDTVRALKATDLKARVLVRNPESELGELAQLFNEMLSQIEGLITGMQHALDAVAHDLRTPLARMRLSLESALSGSDEAALREALLDCAEESERIETMLKTLMDISEAESGILKLRPERLKLSAVVAETVDLYRYAAEDRSVYLAVEPGDEVELVADPVRLHQVLGNLLDNAIKYSNAGGQVRVGWSLAAEQVVLRVSDDGVGIEPEHQARVFDRLYRADQSRGEPGMGLGLSLVKAVVTAHRGTIQLYSTPGQGCRVEVALPAGATG